MKKIEKIAVLGGGNGAHAMAADLALKEFQVRICEAPEFEANFRATLEQQGVKLIDAWGEEKFVRVYRATTDFKEAVEGVDYIMLAIPAMGHERFFSAIMPYLEDGQTIVSWPGNYAALRFSAMFRESKIHKKITLAEGHTLPWGCRMEDAGRVRIFVEAWKLLVAAMPASETERVLTDLRTLYPVAAGENVLATSMNNLNPIVHPVGCVLNAGWIDTLGKDFYFYRHGTTLSVARAIRAVYEEVKRVAEAIGVRMLEYPEETFWSKSTIMSHYFKAPFDKEGVVACISGPSSMEARYVIEDIPYGLVPIGLLAHQLGLATPIIDAVIEIASIINQKNYWEKGRSLQVLGIAGLDRNELRQVLERGFG
ncbi:MAG: NAD/NADP octopine/nopaline dehydrogenase family protein [Thermodesulfobacteriota bacterium]